jgi:hypothetical protein
VSRWRTAGRLLAAFATGLATAIWLFPVMAGPQIQRLRLERDQALARTEELEEQLAKLKEAGEGGSTPYDVQRVRAEIDGPDERVGLEAERRLQKELARLLGRRVESVSAVGLYTRHQGRLMEIDGLLYQLEVRTITIAPELSLYGELQQVTPGKGSD